MGWPILSGGTWPGVKGDETRRVPEKPTFRKWRSSKIMTADKRILFVTGVGRSGTTAMAMLLNAHPDICLGIERYKIRFLRRGEFDGSEFTQDRFFDFRESDTNILPDTAPKWQMIYEQMRAKFPTASVVGDKIPDFHDRFESCSAIFPEAKWIYMLRDIRAVASSWNVRATTGHGKWSAKKDFRAAVETWNAANHRILGLPADRVMVVGYEQFFGGSEPALGALTNFIGVKPNKAFMRSFRKSCATYAEVVSQKPPMVFEGQEEHIEAAADLDAWRELLARAA